MNGERPYVHSHNGAGDKLNHSCVSNNDCCNPEAQCIMSERYRSGVWMLQCFSNEAHTTGFSINKDFYERCRFLEASYSSVYPSHIAWMSLVLVIVASLVMMLMQYQTASSLTAPWVQPTDGIITTANKKIDHFLDHSVSDNFYGIVIKDHSMN